MKRPSFTIIRAIFLLAGMVLLTAFDLPSTPVADPLKEEVLSILDTKCNVCHRRQNPFMVFKQHNMEKRANHIYRAVFVQRRMPKGNDIELTPEEYATLEQWLKSKISE
ncbi:MAG: hypothetical protein AAFN81_00325 [Bacteroidota bacterium]